MIFEEMEDGSLHAMVEDSESAHTADGVIEFRMRSGVGAPWADGEDEKQMAMAIGMAVLGSLKMGRPVTGIAPKTDPTPC